MQKQIQLWYHSIELHVELEAQLARVVPVCFAGREDARLSGSMAPWFKGITKAILCVAVFVFLYGV